MEYQNLYIEPKYIFVFMTEIKFNGYSFFKVGNSMVISIPAPIIETLKINPSDQATVWVDEKGKIIIEKEK